MFCGVDAMDEAMFGRIDEEVALTAEQVDREMRVYGGGGGATYSSKKQRIHTIVSDGDSYPSIPSNIPSNRFKKSVSVQLTVPEHQPLTQSGSPTLTYSGPRYHKRSSGLV